MNRGLGLGLLPWQRVALAVTPFLFDAMVENMCAEVLLATVHGCMFSCTVLVYPYMYIHVVLELVSLNLHINVINVIIYNMIIYNK